MQTTINKKSSKAVKAAKAEQATVAATTETKAAAKPKKLYTMHNITGSYAGVSTSFGKKPSRTPITAEFNTLPDAYLTERDNAFLRDLKAKYAENVFERNDCDAGNLRRAIERGYINYQSDALVNGLRGQRFQLTEKAIAQNFG